jgi:hypothetical protein
VADNERMIKVALGVEDGRLRSSGWIGSRFADEAVFGILVSARERDRDLRI